MIKVRLEQRDEQGNITFQFKKDLKIHHFTGVKKIAGTFAWWFFDYLNDLRSVNIRLHDSRLPLILTVENNDEIKFSSAWSVVGSTLQNSLKLNNGKRSKLKFAKVLKIMLKHSAGITQVKDIDKVVTDMKIEVAALN